MANPLTQKPQGLTGRHVLIAVLAFFALILAANVAFISLAVTTFSGQVAKNPYEAGLAYNAELDRRAAQAELGWRATPSLRRAGAAAELEITVRDAQGAPLAGLTAEAVLQRPATQTGARTITLNEAAPGVYRAQAALDPGDWLAEATLTDTSGSASFIGRWRLSLESAPP